MKTYLYKILFVSVLVLLGKHNIIAQACCTAGTPLLGSLEMTSAPKGILQFGLTFEHNSLTHVLNGTTKLRNPERERISESALFEINYGITNSLSVTTLFSYIRQARTINGIQNSKNKLNTSGLGDVALLAKYSLLRFDIFNRQELSIGVGIKLPTGNSSLKNNGILIPADMQPGSGSWDGLFWGYYSKGDLLFNDLTLISNVSYRLNGSNDRFEISTEGYSFGNEFITSLGLNYPVTSFLDFTLLSKYRNTSEDTFSSETIPNTGGDWLYIIPGISYYLSDKLSTRLEGELPIYRNVQGTQLTTTFTASFSFFYSLNILEGSFL